MAITTVSSHVVSVNAIQGTLIADNAITAVHIATNAVSGTLIADNAITAVHVAQNSITVTQLADDCVESDKIADGVITTNHLNKAMISSQTEVTPVAGDFVLLGDTSDSNNLKKAPLTLLLNSNVDLSTKLNLSGGTLTGDITLTSGTSNKPKLTITNTNADSTPPYLILKKDSASPADNDEVGRIYMYGDDDAGNATEAFLAIGKMTDVSNGSEDSSVDMYTYAAGAQTATLSLKEGNVGIGTTSPGEKLEVSNTSGGASILIKTSASDGGNLLFGDTDSNSIGRVRYDHSANAMQFYANAAERMRIDSSGNVGIGMTPAPGGSDTVLSLYNSATPRFRLHNSTTGTTASDGGEINMSGSDFILENREAGNVRFFCNDGERMRIDSSGNLLVGTTSTTVGGGGSGVTGFRVDGANGIVQAAASNNTSAIFNRTTSNGAVVSYRLNGSEIGNICTEGNDSLIVQAGTTSGAGLLYHGANSFICAVRNSVKIDNAIDLGRSAHRFREIFCANGTINTSDKNEKQDIEELTDAETRVAVAAKGLLRKFKWKSAVEEKGDEARIHFGIIAQDLQDAFTAEGLDASDYAMWCSDTWTDDDGVEQTRLGVRYSELLAFIIASL